MKQPQLGNRIRELREKKALTQKDLSFKCKISERTLQRIENGHVNPRAYTLKSLSALLEDDFTGQDDIATNSNFAGKNVNYKLLSSSAAILIIIFGFFYFFLFKEGPSSQANIEQIINEKNSQFVHLLNNGEIEEVVKFYRDDACFITKGCGKDFIRDFYKDFRTNFRFTHIASSKISIADTIAIEKGNWSAVSNNGEDLGGEYIAEWKLSNEEWLIVSEISGLSSKRTK